MVETEAAPDQVLADDAGPLVAPAPESVGSRPDRRRHRILRPVSVVVLALGLALTATLALTARSLHESNETRLLRQRVKEAGAVLSAAIPNIQTPLASGAVLAEATNGDRSAFASLMTPLIASGRPFVSASIWSAHASDPRPLVVVGAEPELAGRPPAAIRGYLEQTTAKKTVVILDLLAESPRRLGYGFAGGPTSDFVVYAEASLPENRRASVDSNSAFSDLDYAIYLGATDDTRHVLATSVADPQLKGRTAADDVPFGDSTLRIVMTPRRELGGSLLARLPWLIAGFGSAIALAAALMTERLVQRRVHAEQLAEQNARLFGEQRSVAQTLQHSLLPDEQPEFSGLELAVRYVPGVDGVDIGGDWYDVIGVADGQVLFVVGDVSGRGLGAATQMASLRYAIRAYAAQGDAPEVILFKLTRLINLTRDGHFATVLCGLVNVARREVTIANAGHPNPLLISGAGAHFVSMPVGPPVGVAATSYDAEVVAVPSNGILLAYTDGLFERRGEHPDRGLARLRDAAATAYDSLDRMLDGMLRVLTPDGGSDDTAILALRWHR